MKKQKNQLDEMQEQKLLQIEHNGCWLAFFGLLISLFVQIFLYGRDFKIIAGEWAVFMCLAVYIVVSCLKNGIWDRRMAPVASENLKVSLLAGGICGIIFLPLNTMNITCYWERPLREYSLPVLCLRHVLQVYPFYPIFIESGRNGWRMRKRRRKPMGNNRIMADSLVKTFTRNEKKNKKVDINAVDGISLSVEEGEIVGILGPNGAGKTTLLRMMSKLMRPTSGMVSIRIGEKEITDDIEVKRHIGYLSNNTKLYGRLSSRELLQMLGVLYGMSKEDTEKKLRRSAKSSRWKVSSTTGSKNYLQVRPSGLPLQDVLCTTRRSIFLMNRRLDWIF